MGMNRLAEIWQSWKISCIGICELLCVLPLEIGFLWWSMVCCCTDFSALMRSDDCASIVAESKFWVLNWWMHHYNIIIKFWSWKTKVVINTHPIFWTLWWKTVVFFVHRFQLVVRKCTMMHILYRKLNMSILMHSIMLLEWYHFFSISFEMWVLLSAIIFLLYI